jgi:integrase
MDDALKIVPLVPRKPAPKAMTQRDVEIAKPRAERYEIRDATLPGFLLRVAPSGSKTFYVSTRVGHGRDAKRVRVQIGSPSVLRLAEARKNARQVIADAKAGIDPTAGPTEKPINAHLDDYEAKLIRSEVVRTSDMMMTLRRGLEARLVPGKITRAMVIAEIERLERAGQPGAAEYFRKSAATFLNWLVDRGAITASPMAGYRRPKETRAQKLAQRRWVMTTPDEIRRFWDASEDATNPVYRDLLRFMLLTGQRRTETSLVEWDHLSEDRWDIPAEITKNGEDQAVPLGPLSRALLDAQEHHAGTELVFAGRSLRPISGWTKLVAPVREAYGDDRLSCHGLRRTFRTGLSTLGVEESVAELMIAHKRPDLVGRYDHSDLWDRRVEAQARWENFIGEAVK